MMMIPMPNIHELENGKRIMIARIVKLVILEGVPMAMILTGLRRRFEEPLFDTRARTNPIEWALIYAKKYVVVPM